MTAENRARLDRALLESEDDGELHHQRGFLLQRDGESAEALAAFDRAIELRPGDGVVLYTDGITEAKNINGEQYGLDLSRLCQVVSQNWHGDASQVKQAVIADLDRHIGEQKVFDDITLLVLKQR